MQEFSFSFFAWPPHLHYASGTKLNLLKAGNDNTIRLHQDENSSSKQAFWDCRTMPQFFCKLAKPRSGKVRILSEESGNTDCRKG
jgi:hypothetical protein